MITKMMKGGAAAVLALSMFAPGAMAQSDAKTVDQLLDQIRNQSSLESKEHQARVRQFQAEKSQQQSLLNQANAEHTSLEQRSQSLERQIQDNDQTLTQLREQRDARLGSLKELFGHLSGAAGDARANLQQSLVNVQFPDRTAFIDGLIDDMTSDTKLPSIAQIEQLWFEISREMAESGKVVKFDTDILKVSGEKSNQEVVRIGTYNLVSDGMYLTYNLETGSVSELPRQPSSYQSSAAKLQGATEGFTKVGIDPSGPSGGSLLRALINTPTLMERWHFGGIVGYVITAVGIFGVLLAIWRFIVLAGISGKVSRQLKSDTASTDNPLGRVLKVAEDNPSMDAESLELKLHEAVLKERPAIEAGLSLLKIIAMVAPLLGLLGTVTGMIITFQQITLFGAGDPQAMAGGISQALITTVLGLVVAIPVVLLHTLVNGRAQRVLHVLEEQSAGIIAENAEGK